MPKVQDIRPGKMNLADRAYNQLEELVVTLRLEPGAVLSEGVLASELGFGRTPIREALQRLASRYRLVIVSNVDRVSFAASNEHLGVAFDLIITAEDVGSYKPAPGHFESLCANVTPTNRLLHVAQSLYHDHGPAVAAGLRTVWIDRSGGSSGGGATPPQPDVVPEWRYPTLAAFADAVGV